MCGLVVSVNRAISPADVDLLRHRGPDDSGLLEQTVGHHSVSFGHRRLAIVDLSEAGHQPMQTEDGGGTLAYNGEVYNHEDLRRTLIGARFRGHSDTETVLHHLHANGPQGAALFNGIFALAYLDRRSAGLSLIRDPFGVKPLYYAVDDNQLVVASELAPLRRLVKADIDADSVALLLRMRYLPAPYTLYRGIRKVRPGHYIQVDLSRDTLAIAEQQFVTGNVPPESNLSYRDAVEQYAVLLDQAVSRQMMADTEVGVLLSGGVDSALLAHYATRKGRRRLKAFTIGFAGEHEENEIDEARVTAQATGMDFHHRVIGADDFLGCLRNVAAVVEEPLATTSVVPMYFLSELAAEHVKVVLSGQGADESLGGYGRYRGYLLSNSLPHMLAPVARGVTRALGVRNDQLSRGIETVAMETESDRLLATYQVFSPAEIKALTGRPDHRSSEVLDHAYRTWRCADLRSPVARMMRLDVRLGLPDDLLLYTDRVTMRHSLECRVPYLDTELVSFIESLPVPYRVTLGAGKRIHRAAAMKVLPPDIVRRKKKGFLSPTRLWFKDTSRLRSIFANESASLSRFVDPAGIDRVIQRHAAGTNQERQIFLLLMLMFAVAA